MNPENRWVKKAETIPGDAIEEKYAALFPSKKGMPAKPPPTDGGSDNEGQQENADTLILDATCAPQNISYPQDVNLLNKAIEKLEQLIDIICYEQNYPKPRMYRKNTKKDYLNLAKCKKRFAKKIRKVIKAQLQYIRRDLRYVDEFLEKIDICDFKI